MEAFGLDGEALEGFGDDAGVGAAFEICFDGVVAGAVEEGLLEVVGEGGERGGGIEVEMVGEAEDLPVLDGAEFFVLRPPGFDGAAGDGFGRVGDEEGGVAVEDVAEAVAVGAGALVAIKGKQARGEFRHAETGFGVGESGGEAVVFPGVGAWRLEKEGEFLAGDTGGGVE